MTNRIAFALFCMCVWLSCAPRETFVIPQPTRCDVRVLFVTASGELVWVSNNRERLVDTDTAVKHLVAANGRRERSERGDCVPEDHTPIWYGHTWEQSDPERAKTAAIAESIWFRVGQAGVKYPPPQERPTDMGALAKPPALYRSREQLGSLSEIVPAKFDFDRYWLAVSSAPGPRWQERCPEALDSYMTEDPSDTVDEPARDERQPRPARVLELPYRYTHQGELSVTQPELPDSYAPKTGCRLVNVTEPVLVPIPHTRLTWSFDIRSTSGMGRNER